MRGADQCNGGRTELTPRWNYFSHSSAHVSYYFIPAQKELNIKEMLFLPKQPIKFPEESSDLMAQVSYSYYLL